MQALYLFLAMTFFFNTGFASEMKMTFTGSDDLPKSRIWIPCSFGSCMVDLAGGGSVINVNPHSEKLAILKVINMTTLLGSKKCDLVSAPDVQLAGKTFSQMSIYRCDWFPANNSPMLGLDYFQEQIFSFNFSRETFSWLVRDIQDPKVKLAPLGHWQYTWLSIGSASGRVVIDTGAPLTLVDRQFVQKRPDLFEISKEAPDRAQLKDSISVEGNFFTDRNVMISDLKGTFGEEAPEFFLGMNHIKQANWEFNYSTHEIHIEIINIP